MSVNIQIRHNLNSKKLHLLARISGWIGYSLASASVLAALAAFGIYGEVEQRVEISGLMLGFYAGLGMIIFSHWYPRVHQNEIELKQRFPDEPWRWRKSWEKRIYRVTHWPVTGLYWLAALVWNSIMWPNSWEFLQGGLPLTETLIVAIFPAVGILLFLAAIKQTRLAVRLGRSVLEIETIPAECGGNFRAILITDLQPDDGKELLFTLNCNRQEYRMKNDKGRTTETLQMRTIFSTETKLSYGDARTERRGLTFPLEIYIPPDAEQTGPRDYPNRRVEWKLVVTGPDGYSCQFEIPVFGISDKPVEAAPDFFEAPSNENPKISKLNRAEVLASANIITNSNDENELELILPHSENPKDRLLPLSSGIVLTILAFWMWKVHHYDVAALFAGFFGVMGLGYFVFMVYGTTRLVVSPARLSEIKECFGIKVPNDWPPESIKDIVFTPFDGSPSTLRSVRQTEGKDHLNHSGPWNIILIDNRDDMKTIVSNLSDREAAEVITAMLFERLNLSQPPETIT